MTMCALCQQKLSGVQQEGAKTKKRPNRPFAGILCGSCVRTVVQYKTRREAQVVDLNTRYEVYAKQV